MKIKFKNKEHRNNFKQFLNELEKSPPSGELVISAYIRGGSTIIERKIGENVEFDIQEKKQNGKMQ